MFHYIFLGRYLYEICSGHTNLKKNRKVNSVTFLKYNMVLTYNVLHFDSCVAVTVQKFDPLQLYHTNALIKLMVAKIIKEDKLCT